MGRRPGPTNVAMHLREMQALLPSLIDLIRAGDVPEMYAMRLERWHNANGRILSHHLRHRARATKKVDIDLKPGQASPSSTDAFSNDLRVVRRAK